MRKLGKENRKLFILLTIIVIVIILLFGYFLKVALTTDRNVYEIKAGTLFYDKDYREIIPEEKATLKKRYDGNYHLNVEDKEKTHYAIGPVAIASREDDYALHLYGTAYQISTSGEVQKVVKETKIAKSAPAKFYKISDRKYLFVDKKIYTKDKSIDTSDYLIIELDKQGNATLANQEMNIKTINPIVLKGSIFDFDVVHEKLIYEKNEIDLKNIIGSSNQYTDKEEKEKTEKEDKDKKKDDNNQDTLNYYDHYFKNVVNSFNNLTNSVNTINDNSKDTVKKGEVYFDFSRWISLKKVTSSVTSITLDYTVFDPNSEYQAVFLLVREATGSDTQKIQLNKDNTSYILRELKPDNEYIISLGYRLVGSDEDVYDDSVKAKTTLPSYNLNITKVTKDKIYYNLKIDTGYAATSARVSLYSDSTRIMDQAVDIAKAISKNGFTGSMSYDSLGYFIEVRLEDIVYNGTIITLDVSDKFINE